MNVATTMTTDRGPDFASLFAATPSLYLVLDRDLTIVGVNNAYCRATMTERDAIVGRGLFDVFPDNPDDPDADGTTNLRASLARVLQFKRPDAMAVQKYDIRKPESEGGGFEVRYWSPLNSPVLDGDGEVCWIIHRVEDVTEAMRLKAEGAALDQLTREQQGIIDQLRRANEDLAARIAENAHLQDERRRMQESLEVALRAADMGTWDMDFVHAKARRSLRHDQIFGYSEAQTDWDGAAFLRHVLPEDQQAVREADLRAQSSGELSIECRIKRLDGEIRWVMVKGRTSYDKGAPVRMAGIIADVTDRRSAEEGLRRSQKMEAIGQLTGGIAHDFNNMLTVIVGSLDSIVPTIAGNAKATALADAALEGALRGAELTQRLLAFARRKPLEPKIIDVNERLPGMTDMLRRTLGESIVIREAPARDLWPCVADPGQVEDALMNLAINARDAMPGGGTLTIETGNAHLDDVYARQNVDVMPGDYVVLAVTDTGTGMTPDVLERAIEPFFTTKETGRGTGLGLSMIFGFAKQSGGHFKLYSEPGYGTTAKLYLPRASGRPVAATAPRAAAAELPRGNETILVVEDNAAVRAIAVAQLGELGYRVVEADDGPAALKIIDSGAAIDLLFTDVVMQGGLNGYELAEAVRQRRPGLKMLFTTGFAGAAATNGNGAPHGVKPLSKPYRRQELAARVRGILDGLE